MTETAREEPAAPEAAVSVHARRRLGYIPEFDGLRGLAAVFVVAVHLFMIVIPNKEQLPQEIPGTFVFMDLFFVLSGFLITALLLRSQASTGKVGLGAFYRRRAMRLLPALYVLLVAHALYAWSQGTASYPAGVERSTVLNAAFYGLNWKMDSFFAPVAHGLTQLWSLGVEEQFYVVWPLVVILILPARRKLSTVVGIITAAILAVAAHRWILWNPAMADNTKWMRLYTHTDTRVDSLLVGTLLAYLWVHDVLPPRKVVEAAAWLSVPVLAFFLIAVKLTWSFPYQGGFTIMAIAWAAVILAVVESDWMLRPVLRLRPLRVLGEVSYGIYLWHVPVQYFVREHCMSWPTVGRVVISLVLTAGTVALSWFLVERPFLRWKDRIDKRARERKPRVAPVVAPTLATETNPAG